MWSTTNRRLCSNKQSPVEEILEPSPKLDSRSSGSFSTVMAEEGYVFQPALETDSEGITIDKATKDPSGSASHPILAQPILVSNDSKDETSRRSNYHENQQEVFPSRLEIINEKIRQFGLMKEANIAYIAKSTRKSIVKAYDNGWKQWQQWCS